MTTKKHLNEIARLLKESENKTEIIQKLGNYFGSVNPRFSFEKWRKATQ